MIEAIKLEEDGFSGYRALNESGHLEFLNRINLFIGKNNSGKSRFLRGLINAELNMRFQNSNQKAAQSLLDDFKQKMSAFLPDAKITNSFDQLHAHVRSIPEIAFNS